MSDEPIAYESWLLLAQREYEMAALEVEMAVLFYKRGCRRG